MTDLLQSGYEPHNEWERAYMGCCVIQSAMRYVEHVEDALNALRRLQSELLADMKQCEKTGQRLTLGNI